MRVCLQGAKEGVRRGARASGSAHPRSRGDVGPHRGPAQLGAARLQGMPRKLPVLVTFTQLVGGGGGVGGGVVGWWCWWWYWC